MAQRANERWNERIRLAIRLVDALIWLLVRVWVIILGTYLVERHWGDAAFDLALSPLIALLAWFLHCRWMPRRK